MAGALDAEQTRILDTLKAIFEAARTNDAALFNSVVSPDFYLFEAGSRMDGAGMLALVKTQHDLGKSFEWNITEPDIHVGGDMAWVAYVNKGSVTDATGTKKLSWLESGALRKQEGRWKIVFLHSTRIPS
jgi:ketosteroid isomerase-like protein